MSFTHEGCSPFHHHDEDDEEELHDDEEHGEDDSIPVPPGEICEQCTSLATSEAGGLFYCDDCYGDYADAYNQD